MHYLEKCPLGQTSVNQAETQLQCLNVLFRLVRCTPLEAQMDETSSLSKLMSHIGILDNWTVHMQ
jgi:hypothetical protein